MAYPLKTRTSIYYIFFLLGIFCLSLSTAHAQRLRRTKAVKPKETEGYVSIGGFLAAFNYSGDIPSGLEFTRPGLGVYVSRKIGPRSHARLSLAYGRIEADDFSSDPGSGTYARNLHFRNDILEVTLTGTWEFASSYGRHDRRAGFTPYLFWGVGLFHHNPQARLPTSLGQDWVDLQPLGTEGQGQPGYDDPYGKIQFTMPLGIGLKWAINDRLDFGIETGVRLTFFDYLDDVSGEYPELDDLDNPLSVIFANRTLEPQAARVREPRELGEAQAQFGIDSYTGANGANFQTLGSFRRGQSTRGNPNSNDYYFVTAFKLSYIIDVGLKCPSF